jgi:hypothetical protein
MLEYTFDPTINENGMLNCLNEFFSKEAHYKVSVTVPDTEDLINMREIASIIDSNDDYLSKDELNYYFSLN